MARKQTADLETNSEQPVRGAKTAAIRALFGQGITSALEVAEQLEQQGLSVSMPVIYQTLAKMKKGSKGKPGRKKAAAPATMTSKPAAIVPSATMTADDVRQLAEFTKKVGGVDAVVDMLDAMKAFQ